MQVPTELYPFEGQYLDLDGLRYHYLDEGRGEPVVMVHGNPTWSFYWRKLVLALRDRYRIIVPDHIGCGLSDKPGDDRYEYSFARRADDLERLIDEIDPPQKITLVVHDWGGMIGMTYAVRHPERIGRIVLLNTSAFHLPPEKPFPRPLWLVRDTPVGALLVRGLNFFAYTASKVAFESDVPDEVRRAYRAPYDSWANRIATLRFVQDIPLKPGDRGYELISEVDAKLELFAETPALICWGAKDFVFDDHFLAGWQERWPHAQVNRYEDAGHYVMEDAADRIVPAVEEFLAANPLPEGEG